MSNIEQEGAVSRPPYFENYSIPRITLKKALEHVERHIKYGITRGVITLISEAGEGKSQGIRQLAEKYGRRIVDIRTAQFSLMGAGIPQRADETTGQFKIAVPDDYPKPGEKCIMVFDEVNQGQQHAIAMFFKLLEDRSLYNYQLPDDCIIIALMNPAGAGYNVSRIETNHAITRRLKKFYVYNTFSDWKKWAQSPHFHDSDPVFKGKPCHEWVVQFLTASPNLLYSGKERDLNKPYACPATWQTVSASLYLMEKDGVSLGSEDTEELVASSINTVMAHALIQFIKNNAVRITPEEILKKYKKKSAIRERILTLQQEAGGDYPKVVDSVSHFLFDEKPPPEEIAPQLAQFWHDMPDELAQAFYQMLSTQAQSGGRGNESANIKYMQDLTRKLQVEPLWMKVNERLNAAHDSYERKLKGSKTKDPMAP